MPADFFSDPNDQNVISGPVQIITSRRLKKAGTLSTDDGLLTTDGKGGLTVAYVLGKGSVASQTLASSGTITTAGIDHVRIATAGAVTGIIMAVGTVDGQEITIMNESANSVTFAVVGTSNVADGTSDAIATLTAARYVWNNNASTKAWYRCV